MGATEAGSGYLLLWPQRRLKQLKKADEVGKPLSVLYGSPHSSAPSLARYDIGPSDVVFLLSLQKGVVSVLSRLVIGEMITVHAHLRTLGVSQKEIDLHDWTLWDHLAKERPELGHQLPFGCMDEAAVLAESTPVRLDHAIPPELLASLRLRTKRGVERALPVADGKLTKSTSLQAHFYRLTGESLAALDAFMVESAAV